MPGQSSYGGFKGEDPRRQVQDPGRNDVKKKGAWASSPRRRSSARAASPRLVSGSTTAMNIWLHKQVMRKLAGNGGKVPDDLK
ncbi:hypothetical protein GCM10023144_08860 [Pigmentiphaga soli]|uniref:DUF3597 domain-containing protein n=1 Tax=Pigmentiphaga soli TaxID=1007095 RepID=A0ABP8GKB7_9BURK